MRAHKGGGPIKNNNGPGQLWAFKVKWQREWLKPGESSSHTCVLLWYFAPWTYTPASCHVFPINLIRGKLSGSGKSNIQYRFEMNREKFFEMPAKVIALQNANADWGAPKVCSTLSQSTAVNYKTVKSKRCHESTGLNSHTHIHWEKKRAEGLKGHKPNRQISQQLNPGEIPYKNKQKAKAKQRVLCVWTFDSPAVAPAHTYVHCTYGYVGMWNIILPHCCIKWCQQQPSSWVRATSLSLQPSNARPNRI